MYTAERSLWPARLGPALAPWLVLAVVTAVMVVFAPDGHYGLLLAVAPFVAAAVHGTHVTALVGAATVSLYAGVRVGLPQETGGDVGWIKVALVVAASGSAVLISQARLRERALHRSLDIAAALQNELLPARTAGTSTVEVCHRYIPTDTDAGVGGDWFDVIPLSGARVALTMGDVVGHGIGAAGLMGRMRTEVRTLAELDLSPDELLARMDAAAARHAEDDDTRALAASCLYLAYDPVSRQCTLASAGHPPPALRHPDGTVEFPDLSEHPPLGIGETAFETTTLTLAEGTVIALYTDGLLDLRRRRAEDAFALLAAALAGDIEPLDRLCRRVSGNTVHDPADDAALMLARVACLPAQRVATWNLSADAEAVGRARKEVAQQLGDWDLAELAFTTELIVSELTTNALVHAAAPIGLRLIKDTSLICEISDASHTAPHPRRARALDENGRGLAMVAQLASQWGTRYTDAGKTVWAEQVLT